jgi:hypothetical protein
MIHHRGREGAEKRLEGEEEEEIHHTLFSTYRFGYA